MRFVSLNIVMKDTPDMFSVEVDARDRDSVRTSCEALVDVMAPILHRGHIDGVSDFPAEDMDPAALSALVQIRSRARARAEGRRRGIPRT